MRLTPNRIESWRQAKRHLLLPIVYVRGFAMTDGEINDTTADPFNGFNIGSTLLRTAWSGESRRHVFESPVLRLSQPPYGYRLAFSDGIRGLDAETRQDLAETYQALPADAPRPVLAIYRYYDAASKALGDGVRPGMETYGWGLGRLIADLRRATSAPGVYLVAHSMGGLVARCFLQNEVVLDGLAPENRTPCAAVEALLRQEPHLRLTQEEWAAARAMVRRLFTYGTPHKGISAQGGFGNDLLGPLDALFGKELGNFEQDRMRRYLRLDRSQEANSLAGRFPLESAFCLVGTAAADYPAAWNLSRRLIGENSDGLVEIDNAVLQGPAPGGGTALAARAYVRRAHSGPYGMVNSEEGFGNLSRFLFGDLRVDGALLARRIELPPGLAQEREQRRAKGQDATVRASYSFETSLRLRGAPWVLTERTARDGSALFRRYHELFPEADLPREIGDQERLWRERERHRQMELFSVFLDTQFRTLDRAEKVQGKELNGTLGFALRLRAAVPDYELAGGLWRRSHYEGSALLDRDLVFLAFEDAAMPGGWGLAWGENTADDSNAGLGIVGMERPDPPGAIANGPCWRALPDAVEFWLPISNAPAVPRFEAWLRLTARRWNQG